MRDRMLKREARRSELETSSLPSSYGGLGIRAPGSLAHASFLSACASVSDMAAKFSGGAPDLDEPRALAQWRERAGGANPPQGVSRLRPARGARRSTREQVLISCRIRRHEMGSSQCNIDAGVCVFVLLHAFFARRDPAP